MDSQYFSLLFTLLGATLEVFCFFFKNHKERKTLQVPSSNLQKQLQKQKVD